VSEGGRFKFDVQISKPLGVELLEFPSEPGVGIARIVEGGSIYALNTTLFEGNDPGTYVLEGDEVIAVNGQDCEGADLDEVLELIDAADASSFTMRLARNWILAPKSPVKVVFRGGETVTSATVKRGGTLRGAVEMAGYPVSTACLPRQCKCKHRDVTTGEIISLCSARIGGMHDVSRPLILEPLSE